LLDEVSTPTLTGNILRMLKILSSSAQSLKNYRQLLIKLLFECKTAWNRMKHWITLRLILILHVAVSYATTLGARHWRG